MWKSTYSYHNVPPYSLCNVEMDWNLNLKKKYQHRMWVKSNPIDWNRWFLTYICRWKPNSTKHLLYKRSFSFRYLNLFVWMLFCFFLLFALGGILYSFLLFFFSFKVYFLLHWSNDQIMHNFIVKILVSCASLAFLKGIIFILRI